MKKRIVKKYLKNKIEFGWRAYLELKIPYELLNLNAEDYMSINTLEETLDLKWTGEEAGFVDHFEFTEPEDSSVKVKVSLHHNSYGFHPQFEDQLYHQDEEGTYYYLEGYRGILNPNYKEDNTEEYWMPDTFWRWTLTSEDKEKGLILLKKYANNRLLLESLFSGNWLYGLLAGVNSNEIEQDLKRELAELSDLCKTIYLDYQKDYFKLTYAIRYRDDVNQFINRLTNVIMKHNLNYKHF